MNELYRQTDRIWCLIDLINEILCRSSVKYCNICRKVMVLVALVSYEHNRHRHSQTNHRHMSDTSDMRGRAARDLCVPQLPAGWYQNSRTSIPQHQYGYSLLHIKAGRKAWLNSWAEPHWSNDIILQDYFWSSVSILRMNSVWQSQNHKGGTWIRNKWHWAIDDYWPSYLLDVQSIWISSALQSSAMNEGWGSAPFIWSSLVPTTKVGICDWDIISESYSVTTW